MSKKSARSKATEISMKVKNVVWERDNHHCIYCGKTGYGVMPNAHFIPRSKGGLGVEENIVTLCQHCHYNYDFGAETTKSTYRHFIRNYLKSKYEGWNEQNLIYSKFNF